MAHLPTGATKLMTRKLLQITSVILVLMLLSSSTKANELYCKDAIAVDTPCVGILLPPEAGLAGIECIDVLLPQARIKIQEEAEVWNARLEAANDMLALKESSLDRVNEQLDRTLEALAEAEKFPDWESVGLGIGIGAAAVLAVGLGVFFATAAK